MQKGKKLKAIVNFAILTGTITFGKYLGRQGGEHYTFNERLGDGFFD